MRFIRQTRSCFYFLSSLERGAWKSCQLSFLKNFIWFILRIFEKKIDKLFWKYKNQNRCTFMHLIKMQCDSTPYTSQFLYYSICDSLTHFPTRRFYFLLFLPTPFVSSAKRSSRLRLEMSFLRVYLYVCWPLTSDALNRKMMYAIEIGFLWKLSVLAFS